MFTILRSELRREFRIWSSYTVSATLEVVVYSIVFVLLMGIFQNMAQQSGTTYGVGRQTSSIIGILIWHLCMRTMAQLPTIITEESETGTLETIMTLSVSPLNLLLGRAVAVSLVRGMQTLLMALLIALMLRLSVQFSPWVPVVTLLTLAGAWGMGLLFAGITLVYKQAATIASLVGMLSLFAAGALVPINSLGILFTLFKLIIPITWGTDILRRLLVTGQPVNNNIIGLALQAAVMLSVGVIVFNLGLRKARQMATLATY